MEEEKIITSDDAVTNPTGDRKSRKKYRLIFTVIIFVAIVAIAISSIFIFRHIHSDTGISPKSVSLSDYKYERYADKDFSMSYNSAFLGATTSKSDGSVYCYVKVDFSNNGEYFENEPIVYCNKTALNLDIDYSKFTEKEKTSIADLFNKILSPLCSKAYISEYGIDGDSIFSSEYSGKTDKGDNLSIKVLDIYNGNLYYAIYFSPKKTDELLSKALQDTYDNATYIGDIKNAIDLYDNFADVSSKNDYEAPGTLSKVSSGDCEFSQYGNKIEVHNSNYIQYEYSFEDASNAKNTLANLIQTFVNGYNKDYALRKASDMMSSAKNNSSLEPVKIGEYIIFVLPINNADYFRLTNMDMRVCCLKNKDTLNNIDVAKYPDRTYNFLSAGSTNKNELAHIRLTIDSEPALDIGVATQAYSYGIDKDGNKYELVCTFEKGVLEKDKTYDLYCHITTGLAGETILSVDGFKVVE